MSTDIGAVGRTPTPASALPAPATPVGAAAPATAPAHVPGPVTVDAIPTSPPPEVHEAMGVAATAYENLKASGREMRFRVDEATGKLSVEVHDIHGNFLFRVPSSKALDIAAGGSLD